MEGYTGIAHMYQHGIGVDADISQAVKYYSLAAEKGSSDAQFHLGMLYFCDFSPKAFIQNFACLTNT